MLDKIFSLSPVISALDSTKLGVFSKSFFDNFDPDKLVLLSSDARSWIKAQGYHILVDSNGNEKGISTDITKPVFMQAFVSDNKDITMTFNEPMMSNDQASALPSLKSFKVVNTTNKAIKYTIDEITCSASSGGRYEVTLKLMSDGNPVTSIDPKHHLLLSYTDPSKADDWNALQDSSGNDLISLTGVNVINNGFGA